jgi:hypothetical protein
MAKMIFVVGGKHSGTTLTATILGANSKCWMVPMESGAYSKKHIKQLRKPFVDKVSSIDSEFVVEKTPDHVFEVDKIQEDWPQSPIFVVTRNPLDRVASTYRRHGNFNQSIYECSQDLSGCISAMRYENTHLVQYESIVKNFNKTVKEMCDFAGLMFEDSMINFHENSPTWYEKQLHDEHHKIRSDQMKQPLFDGTGIGYEILDNQQIGQVLFDCADKYQTLTGKSPINDILLHTQ